MDNTTIALAFLPLLLISAGLEIFALVDLLRRDPSTVKGGQKWPWVIVILLVSTIGAIVYLVAGRTENGSY